MIGIYKIENKINGKCYIGQSNDIELRFRQHKYAIQNMDTSWYLEAREESNDINDFDFSILQNCKLEELDELEAYWINYYKSNIIGYNKKFASQGILLLSDDFLSKENEYSIDTIIKMFEQINIKISGKCGNVRTLLLYLILEYQKGIKILPVEQKILKSCNMDHAQYVRARTALCNDNLITYNPYNSITINFKTLYTN